MSTATLIINGIRVAIARGPAPQRKWCKFCCRHELAVRTCNHIDAHGRRCGNGICEHHTIKLGPDLECCPLHDPDRVYQPQTQPVEVSL